ncbi:MAG: polyprenyl synthetase family protein [Gammaproteobacteria bacterium]|nr:polyprenyl synthetase family protein [Gammaproteobacteria bacterium]
MESSNLETWLADRKARFERELRRRLLLPIDVPARLASAIRYSMTNGGKRLRPMLAYASAELLDIAPGRVDAVAVAVEMIHCYSLVHDDLPAMDDDDLRRGRATTHRAYDEATAILVGDALQMQAFELLTTDPGLPADPAVRLRLVRLLSRAGGPAGMTGGQAMDLEAEGCRLDVAELDRIHALKTGELIKAAVLMAAVCGEASEELLGRLSRFGDAVGLAFQVRDDLLDIDGDERKLGKPIGSDLGLNKATYPALLGREASLERLEELRANALAAVADLGPSAEALRQLAIALIDRDH